MIKHIFQLIYIWYIYIYIYIYIHNFLNDISNYRIQIVLKKHYMNWIASRQSPFILTLQWRTWYVSLSTINWWSFPHIVHSHPFASPYFLPNFLFFFLFYDMFESAFQVRLESSSFWISFVPPDTQKICSYSLPAWASSHLHVIRILRYQFKSIHCFVFLVLLLIPNRIYLFGKVFKIRQRKSFKIHVRQISILTSLNVKEISQKS